MKNIFILIALFIVGGSAIGQSMGVRYEEKIGEKTNLTFLEFNKQYSVYYKPNIKHNTQRTISGGSEIRPANTIDSIANKPRYIGFRKKDSTFISNLINFDVEKLVKHKVSVSWEISTETKEIMGHKCIKAIGTLGGKKYDAWYAPDIQAHYGPIMINGLPGLILELTQPDTNMHIIAVDIKKIQKEPAFLKKIQKEDFQNALTLEQYDDWRREKLGQIEKEDHIKLPKNSQNKIDLDCKNCNR